MSLLIEHATLIDPDPAGATVHRDARLYVEEERIVEVDGPQVEADRVLDATGHLVLPGMVNAHTHAAMVLLRGIGDELALEAWLETRIWPMEAHFTAETVRAGTELAIAEMLACGTTGFLDMYFFEDQVAQAALDAGIRCRAGFTLADPGTPEHVPEDLLPEARKFLERWPADGSLVQGSIAPHATYTCGPDTLEAAAELSAHHGCTLQTHCSETRHEVYSVRAEHGHRPVEQLARHGCLNQRTVLAHCGWITKAEAREIADKGARVAHNPVANMKLATGGYAPVPELLEAGAPVGLGTDGAASNNRLDPFETMKATSLVHKHHRWEHGLLPADEVLSMQTRTGAELLGLQDGGRVTEGAPADLCILDARKPHLQPLHDP
ncbi:MAG: amidohydrolase, partial [Candidatus Thermoplasmatota archaeon]|nr:amidohydrolase [Candidatus Thermoplasmatota archaeon]